jgi:DNA-binding NarL/FixJ family response regulator
MTIRIVIIAWKIVHEFIAKSLNGKNNIEVAGVATSGIEGTELATNLKPQIVLMNGVLSDMKSWEATEKLRRLLPLTEVITLSNTLFEPGTDRFAEVYRAGTIGDVWSDSPWQELCLRIHQAVEGHWFVHPCDYDWWKRYINREAPQCRHISAMKIAQLPLNKQMQGDCKDIAIQQKFWTAFSKHEFEKRFGEWSP